MKQHHDMHAEDSGLEALRHLSAQDLATLGLQDIAYVKPVCLANATAYFIHAADGTQMAVAPDRDLAFASVRQHGMEPLSVH